MFELEIRSLLAKPDLTFKEVCAAARNFDDRCYKTPSFIRQFVDRAVELASGAAEIIELEKEIVDLDICNLIVQRYAELKGIRDFTEARLLYRSIFSEKSAEAAVEAIAAATKHLKIKVDEGTTLDQIDEMSYVACLRKDDPDRMRLDLGELAKGAANRIRSHEGLKLYMRLLETPDFRATLLGQWAALQRPKNLQELYDICRELFQKETGDEETYLALILESSTHFIQEEPLGWLTFLRKVSSRTRKGSRSYWLVNDLSMRHRKQLMQDERLK